MKQFNTLQVQRKLYKISNAFSLSEMKTGINIIILSTMQGSWLLVLYVSPVLVDDAGSSLTSFNLFSMNNHQYSASDRPKNYKVALAIIFLMSTGVAARLIWIW